MNLDLLQRHHRVASRLLVGSGMSSVECQRIDVWRRFLLLDQAAQNAGLDRVQDRQFGHAFVRG